MKKNSNKNQVTQPTQNSRDYVFTKQNYQLLLLGLALLFLGFILMIGGSSDDPKVFNESVFNFRRLTLSPILIIAGFVIEIFAIMKKPKNK